eukprot:933593-Prymnesium_polylepis.1
MCCLVASSSRIFEKRSGRTPASESGRSRSISSCARCSTHGRWVDAFRAQSSHACSNLCSRGTPAHHVDSTPFREECGEPAAQAEGQELTRPGVPAGENVRHAPRRRLILVVVRVVPPLIVNVCATHPHIRGCCLDPLLRSGMLLLARMANEAASDDEVVLAQRRDAPRRPAQLPAA